MIVVKYILKDKKKIFSKKHMGSIPYDNDSLGVTTLALINQHLFSICWQANLNQWTAVEFCKQQSSNMIKVATPVCIFYEWSKERKRSSMTSVYLNLLVVLKTRCIWITWRWIELVLNINQTTLCYSCGYRRSLECCNWTFSRWHACKENIWKIKTSESALFSWIWFSSCTVVNKIPKRFDDWFII